VTDAAEAPLQLTPKTSANAVDARRTLRCERPGENAMIASQKKIASISKRS